MRIYLQFHMTVMCIIGVNKKVKTLFALNLHGSSQPIYFILQSSDRVVSLLMYHDL